MLLALADNANDEGVCWPSLTTIAKKAGMDERSARRILRRLEKEGFLRTSQRQSPGRKNYTNIYQIVLTDTPNSSFQNHANDPVDMLQDESQEATIEEDKSLLEAGSDLSSFCTSLANGGHNVPTLGTVLPPTGGHNVPTLGTVLPPKPSINSSPNQQTNPPDAAKGRPEKFSRIVKIYEREIGSLTGYIGQEIDNMLDDYPEEWIMSAFREAALHNKRNFAYVKAILKRYKEEGINTTAPKTRQATHSGHPNQHKKSNQDGFAAAENRSLRNLEEIISKGEIDEYLL